jgi:ParB family chromosome partitioning protein
MSVDALRPGQYQPRKRLDENTLGELAESIANQGMIQPIVVRPVGAKTYEIIAGERRWRAAKKLALATVPVIIKDISDQEAMSIALIENIQREDLNVMEEAHAFERLLNEFSMTHESIAQAVGKSRVSISNLLRLLRLDPTVQMWLENSDLTMGHGRALLGLSPEEQVSTAQHVIEKSLSVRQTEALVKAIQSGQSHQDSPKPPVKLTQKLKALQKSLSSKFNAPAKIKPNRQGGGTLVFKYKDLGELARVFDQLI